MYFSFLEIIIVIISLLSTPYILLENDVFSDFYENKISQNMSVIFIS